MAVIGISGFTASLALNIMQENAEKEKIETFSNDVSSILSGFDKRIANDGFNLNEWNDFISSGFIFSNRQQVTEFLNRSLIARDAQGCGLINGWVPVKDPDIDDDFKDNFRFIPCDLWTSNLPFDLNVKSEILNDGTFVTGFNLDIFFDSDLAFEENYLSLKKSISLMRTKDSPNRVGIHDYQFISDNTGLAYSSRECITAKTDCILRASFTGSDNAYETLYTNGSNNMIGSKVKFQEDLTSDAMQTCHRYEQDTAGNWSKTTSVYCGIGYGYKGPISPTSEKLDYVEIAVESVSTDKIFLNKICKLENSGSVIKETPCGIYVDPLTGGDVVVANYDEIYSDTALVGVLETSELKAGSVEVLDSLSSSGTTLLKDTLTVKGEATFEDVVTITGTDIPASDPNGYVLKVSNKTNLMDVDVDGQLTVFGQTEIEENVNIGGSLRVQEKLSTKNVQLTTSINASSLGENCSSYGNGTIIYFNEGIFSDLAVCANNKWKLVNTQAGQIVAFDGTCPTGFKRFTKAEGRTLLGEGQLKDEATGLTLTYDREEVGGSAYHILSIDEMPSHSHKYEDIYYSERYGPLGRGDKQGSGDTDYDNNWYTRTDMTDEVGGGLPHENRMPYYVVNWCTYEG